MHPNPQLLALQRWQLQQKIRQRLDDLEAFSFQVETLLSSEKGSVETDASLTQILYPDKFDDHAIQRYQEASRRLAEDFPQALRASVLSMILAAFEVHLLAIARFQASIRSKQFDEAAWSKKKDKKGKEKNRGRIWGAKDFLEEECGVLASATRILSPHETREDYWRKITDYQNIRIAIVQGDGGLTSLKNPRATRASVRRLEHVERDMSWTGQPEMHDGFIAEAVAVRRHCRQPRVVSREGESSVADRDVAQDGAYQSCLSPAGECCRGECCSQTEPQRH